LPQSELNPLQRVLTCRGAAPHGWLPACFALSEAGFGILTCVHRPLRQTACSLLHHSALFTLGGFVSSLLLSPLRARFGLTKRATLLAATVVGSAGAALQAFSWSVAALGAGRALMGMGAGVGVAVVPGYLK
jgi:predicted MFS family arabinose efflux permease